MAATVVMAMATAVTTTLEHQPEIPPKTGKRKGDQKGRLSGGKESTNGIESRVPSTFMIDPLSRSFISAVAEKPKFTSNPRR